MSDSQYRMIRRIEDKAAGQYPDLSAQISAAIAATLVDDAAAQVKGGVSDPLKNTTAKAVVDGLYDNPETNAQWLRLKRPSWYL